MEQYFSFEKLKVYQDARVLVADIYALTATFPHHQIYGLTSQLQRSIVSVPSNIAEGSGRFSVKEKVHFLEIAYGSLMEAYCQIQIAGDIGYIPSEEVTNLKRRMFKLSTLINNLSKGIRDKEINTKSKTDNYPF